MNKYLALPFAFIFIMGCNSTQVKKDSDESSSVIANNLNRVQLEQVLMGRYQVIAGAWYVNKNCNILSKNESALLEKHVGELNVYAQHKRLAPSNVLIQMQKNAKSGAFLPVYKECGEKSKNMVLAAHQLSIMLYQDLIESK